MTKQMNLGGSFTLGGTAITVNRMGYGAMQLAGRDGNKVVWGPPRDVEEGSPFCARPWPAASTTSTPAITMGRMSPIN